ncbi:hypothetical protein N7454_003400 [Penicillium verhagenii]|nr:hypothetical protein N7454_003400 [Penicillium verhagenii]
MHVTIANKEWECLMGVSGFQGVKTAPTATWVAIVCDAAWEVVTDLLRQSKMGAAPGGSTSNTEQLLEKARKEQADLQHIVDQTQHILEHTQRMLDHKTKEVNALDCAVKEAQVT